MNKTISLLFFSLLIGCSTLNAKSIQDKMPSESITQYDISFNETNPKLIKIEASFILEDSVLNMSPNGTKPKRWAHYIHNLVAYNSKGKSIGVENIDSTAWKIDTKFLGKRISIHYEVLVDHEKENWPGGIDGVAFVRDWGVTLSGRSIFVSNGNAKKNIKVTFKKPKYWKISTPWKKMNLSNETYMVSSRLQLEESFLFAGISEEFEIARDGFNLKFILAGDKLAKSKDKYQLVANGILNYYSNLMDGLPKPDLGNKLSKVLVIANQSTETDGEVIGKSINLFLDPEANMQQQIQGWFMFAHEFFHLWNGQTITFPNNETTTWFMEGITNYYTIKALYNNKLANENGIKMVLSRLFYNRYVSDTGYGTLSLSKAASGIEKENHWGLVYGGGLFAGICMDMEIRYNTNNSNSLDDLMRNFYTKYGGQKHEITNEDILEQVNLLGKTDFSQFIESHITGTEIIPLEKYLGYAGISIIVENNQLRLMKKENQSELQQKLWEGFLGSN